MRLSNKILMGIIKLVVAVYGLKTKKKLYIQVETSQSKFNTKSASSQKRNFDFLKNSNLSGCINYDKFKDALYKEYNLFGSNAKWIKI